jgi:transketolase
MEKLADNLFAKNLPFKAIREGFGDGLMILGKNNPDVVVLCCDLAESTKSLGFIKNFPQRYVEVGVAEQNMIGLAAGLAHEGKIPFCSSYAVFSPGRNWDQIRVSVCYSGNNVKIAGHHAGISVGPDGATHQAMEDIAMMRVLPNLTVLAPCDALETQKVILAAAYHQGPVYIRLMREKTPLFTVNETSFQIGKASVFREGKDCTIAAIGPQVYYALEAAEELSKKGVECEVLNMVSIKPLDEKTLVMSVKKTGCLVSAEEHQIFGGLGSALAEALVKNYPVPQEFVGMPDSFGESGEARELVEKWGMGKTAIIQAVEAVIKRK